MTDRRQFNVSLSESVIRRVKHAAVDRVTTLSALVEAALVRYLEADGLRPRGVTPLPVVYVTDIYRSREFYERLGLRARTADRSGRWIELADGDGGVALHVAHATQRHEPAHVELTFEVGDALDGLRERLVNSGDDVLPEIEDDSFGRVLVVHDPDGLPIQLTERDPELFA